MQEPQANLLQIAQPLKLKNGATLPNRIAKAAMEESLCDADHGPSDELINLYKRWSAGKPGLLITGNVMIDRRALTGPMNVVVEDDKHLDGLKAWAAAGKTGGNQLWAQISHPGRQVYAMVSEEPVAPSAVAMEIKGAKGMFATPRALAEEEILDIIQRFATTAQVMERAGFDGVQLHGAPGYLISQFLSPLTNHRTDQWGGSLGNRARLLIEAVRAVRAAVSSSFAVSVKLNSADFQRGGFSEEDAEGVTAMLEREGLDLLEISGGSYESPAMTGKAADGKKLASTLAREAYFLEFAERLRGRTKMPLMVTGGFRTLSGMEEALKGNALDVIGMGKPFAENPGLPEALFSGASNGVALKAIKMPLPALTSMAEMAWAKTQIHRTAAGKKPSPIFGPFLNLIMSQIAQRKAAKQYRAWLRARSAV